MSTKQADQQPEQKQKTSLIANSLLISVILFPTICVAQGTRLIDTTVLNESINSDTANVLSGNHGLVSTGSVNIEDAQIDNSVIINRSVNNGTTTIARGNGKVAATGSIIIKNKQLSQVKILNASNNSDTVSIANQSSRALIGSIHIAQ